MFFCNLYSCSHSCWCVSIVWAFPTTHNNHHESRLPFCAFPLAIVHGASFIILTFPSFGFPFRSGGHRSRFIGGKNSWILPITFMRQAWENEIWRFHSSSTLIITEDCRVVDENRLSHKRCFYEAEMKINFIKIPSYTIRKFKK